MQYLRNILLVKLILALQMSNSRLQLQLVEWISIILLKNFKEHTH